MNGSSTSRLALLAAAMVCGLAARAQPAATTPAVPLSNAQYSAVQERIDADYKAAKAACDRLAGNAEDICSEEAKGRQKIAEAELQYQRTGKPDDAAKVAEVRAEADYQVAKERCDDLNGNNKDVCMKEAKAAETRAKADARATDARAETRRGAEQATREADYEVAMERCDTLSGAAKSECQKDTRARFDKR